ncbi:hypothetical protein PanWU01x14_177900 [Parasponia andersonii]|uniref:Uncharacterized protein n=1 Tax=Parasponia andersonii TaxID=3476 RepID=A0A2P5C7F5_PARAD|nr:hypothetical protein PanWU01x14_177900 [Parasponia andersonii]
MVKLKIPVSLNACKVLFHTLLVRSPPLTWSNPQLNPNSRSHIIRSNVNEDDEFAAVNGELNLKLTKEEGADSGKENDGVSKKKKVSDVNLRRKNTWRSLDSEKGNWVESIGFEEFRVFIWVTYM